MDEELEFEKEWLSVEKLEFKLLTLITVLADNSLASARRIRLKSRSKDAPREAMFS